MRVNVYATTVIAIVGALALLGFMLPMPNPGVVFEVETTYHSGSDPESATMVFHGPHNLKMEILPGEHDDEDAVKDEMIYRGDRGEIVVVDHNDKSYLVMSKEVLEELAKGLGNLKKMTEGMQIPEEVLKNLPAEQRKQLEEAQRKMGQTTRSEMAKVGAPRDEYRKTGERATKAGYPCVKYEVIRNGKKVRELWVTDWDNVEGSDEVKEVFNSLETFFKELKEAFEESMGGGELFDDGEDPFDGFFEVDGFPVVTRDFEYGELESESTLRSAERRTIDPADFEPPKGYKRRSMLPE